jgi:hypothetical protein
MKRSFVGRAFLPAAGLLAGALTLQAESYYLAISGLGGEQEYDQRFSGWSTDLTKLLQNEPNAKVDSLVGKDATKPNIESKLKAISSTTKAGDTFVLFLIGHGSYDLDYKFNIPGPDISATELAALLDKIPAQQVVVNMTSASGGAIQNLQKPKRVLITATKTGTEKNATIFARYFIEALRDASADSDKNDAISALEAFRYAEQKTAKFFETQKRLATEHALIEDTGKGEGVKAPSSDKGEGILANRVNIIHTGAVATYVNNPEKQKLLKQKEDLEAAIDDLKYKKAAMSVPEYRSQMQKLLLELAKTQEALDK